MSGKPEVAGWISRIFLPSYVLQRAQDEYLRPAFWQHFLHFPFHFIFLPQLENYFHSNTQTNALKSTEDGRWLGTCQFWKPLKQITSSWAGVSKWLLAITCLIASVPCAAYSLFCPEPSRYLSPILLLYITSNNSTHYSLDRPLHLLQWWMLIW